MTAAHITYGYWCTCSSFAERVKTVWCGLPEKATTLPRSPVALLQAGSLRSGSVSHLNKHRPAEDGGEFVEASKKLLYSMKASKPVSFLQMVYDSVITKFWTLMLLCVWRRKIVSETVSVAPLPSRLWFLSYRDTTNHLTTVYLLWNVYCDISGS